MAKRLPLTEIYKKYEVKADSVADFLERYTKTDRHSGRGEEYVQCRIQSHTESLEKLGYTIITHHDSKTGEVVSYYGTPGPKPNTYKALKEKRQKEFGEFPMMFAFSNKQFDEGMKKLGLEPTDTDKIYSLKGTGGYYRRTDAAALKEMFARYDREMSEAIAADSTGEGFIFDMFNYELANHEYTYTGSIQDTLNALGMTFEEVSANQSLLHGLNKARKAQYDA